MVLDIGFEMDIWYMDVGSNGYVGNIWDLW